MDVTDPVTGTERCRQIGDVLGLLGDKWTLPVVMILSQQPRRFNDIKRAVSGISQQMLTRTLRALERDGMVARTVHPTVPPQVEYALSPLGQSLARSARDFGQWAQANHSEIDRSRALFDARED